MDKGEVFPVRDGSEKRVGVGPPQEGHCGSSYLLATSWLGWRLPTGLGAIVSSSAETQLYWAVGCYKLAFSDNFLHSQQLGWLRTWG